MNIEKVLARVSFDHDCWRWNGSHDQHGYGRVSPRRGTTTTVHRVIYEAMVAPIPPGLEIDHLCRNRGCCNPLHLEPVAHRTNMRRGLAGAHFVAKTHCPAGHAYEQSARVTVKVVDGVEHRARACRICTRQHMANHRARRRAQKGA